ncbi:MAG: cache domain-containing protein, partial [Rhodoferax sp.]
MGWWVALHQMDRIRSQQLVEQTRTCKDMAELMAGELGHSLQQVDQTLQGLTALLHTQGAASAFQATRAQGALALGVFQQISLVNLQGQVLYSSDPQAVGSSLAEKPYFKERRATDADQTQVWSMEIDPRLGSWVVPVTRRVDGRAGRFEGTVVTLVALDAFLHHFKSLRLTGGSEQLLLQSDGSSIVGVQGGNILLGEQAQSFGSREFSQQWQAKASGRYRSPVDGVERFFSVRQVPGFPLRVMHAVP